MARGSKTTEWILKLVDKVTAPLRAVFDQATQSTERVARLQDHLDKLKDRSQMLQGALVKLTIGVAAFAALTYSSLRFDEGMAKINATAQVTPSHLASIREELIGIGEASGGNFARVPESFEKILSQVNDTDLSLEIMKAAVDGAKAGFADLDVVAGALANTMSVVGKENATAREVLDTFIRAKDLGGGEFADFASNMPQLIAAGKNLGITYRDVAGIFSFMTGKGNDAASSTMLIQNAFSALMKEPVMKGLQKRGIQLFDREGNLRNIGLIFSDLERKLSGMSDKKKVSFFQDIGLVDVQARNAFAILSSDTEKLMATLQGTGSALGATDRSLEATGNHMRTIGDLTDRFRAIVVKLMPAIYPALDVILKVVEGVAMLTGAFVENFPRLSAFILIMGASALALGIFTIGLSLATTRYQIMITQFKLGEGPLFFFINGIRKATIATWGFIRSAAASAITLGRMGLGFLVTGFQAIGSFVVGLIAATAATWGLNIAMYANPIGLIIIGILAVGAAVYGLIKYWDQVKAFLVKMGQMFLKFHPFSWLIKLIDEVFPGFKKWIADIFTDVINWFSRMWEKIKPVFGAIASFLGLDADLPSVPGEIPSKGSAGKNDPTSGLDLSKGGSGGLDTSDGGSLGGKSVIMNMKVTQNNYIQGAIGDLEKLKRDLVGTIAAAGRDALAVI